MCHCQLDHGRRHLHDVLATSCATSPQLTHVCSNPHKRGTQTAKQKTYKQASAPDPADTVTRSDRHRNTDIDVYARRRMGPTLCMMQGSCCRRTSACEANYKSLMRPPGLYSWANLLQQRIANEHMVTLLAHTTAPEKPGAAVVATISIKA